MTTQPAADAADAVEGASWAHGFEIECREAGLGPSIDRLTTPGQAVIRNDVVADLEANEPNSQTPKAVSGRRMWWVRPYHIMRGCSGGGGLLHHHRQAEGHSRSRERSRSRVGRPDRSNRLMENTTDSDSGRLCKSFGTWVVDSGFMGRSVGAVGFRNRNRQHDGPEPVWELILYAFGVGSFIATYKTHALIYPTLYQSKPILIPAVLLPPPLLPACRAG